LELIEELLDGIRTKNLRLTVMGIGYVGLPTAVLLADKGFHVDALDIKHEIVSLVNNGTSTINEPGLQELLLRNVKDGRLKATMNPQEAVGEADAVLLTVQTPIDQNMKPNLSFLMKALEDVGKSMRKGMLVVICSTIPPGTMQDNVKPKLESLSGLESDLGFYLAYVPERIAPGNALREFVESPRLVGGIGPNSTSIAAELFGTVCKKVIETDAVTAEVAKLAENTFRDINIAYANQLALICEQVGADVTDVIRLANTHPRVNILFPGPGVGGPCLPKDPYLLLYSSEHFDHDVVTTARRMNDYMPQHIVGVVVRALERAGKKINKSRIAVLGTAYKGDIDDSRLSPSEPIIKELLLRGAHVTAYDPHSIESFGANKTRVLNEAIHHADCTVILTDHMEFKNLDLKEVKRLMNRDPVIIDGRRIINLHEAEELGFACYGVGSGKPKSSAHSFS
jgi:UDP-N-acetyl-D-mannosaminuronic acid dehydrogenase